MPPLSDLDVYQHLVRAADDLDKLSAESGSLIGETALKTAAMSVRGMATAVYEHSLSSEEEPH